MSTSAPRCLSNRYTFQFSRRSMSMPRPEAITTIIHLLPALKALHSTTFSPRPVLPAKIVWRARPSLPGGMSYRRQTACRAGPMRTRFRTWSPGLCPQRPTIPFLPCRTNCLPLRFQMLDFLHRPATQTPRNHLSWKSRWMSSAPSCADLTARRCAYFHPQTWWLTSPCPMWLIPSRRCRLRLRSTACPFAAKRI